jgi:hypothetical protein
MLPVAAFAAIVFPYVAPSGDARFALAWGDLLASGETPDFNAPGVPVKHPLEIAITTALAPLGTKAALDIYTVLSILAFLAFLYAVFRLGRALWSPALGLLAVALLVTRPELILYGTNAYRDVPFAALVLFAAALTIESTTRNWRTALILLAVAGLIRPEAWALSILYAGWLERRRRRGEEGLEVRPAPLVALAFAAPVLWATFDLVLTGDLLDTYRSTDPSETGEGGGGDDGGAGAGDFYLRTLENGIPGLIGWPLTLLGAAAGVWALWRRHQQLTTHARFAAKAAHRNTTHTEPEDPAGTVALMVAALLAFYVGLAVLSLPVSPRFLLAAASALATLALTLLALRHLPAVAIALTIGGGAMLVALPGDVSEIGDTLEIQHDRHTREADLADLARQARVGDAADRCRRLGFAAETGSFANRGRAIVAPELGLDPASIQIRRALAPKRGDAVFFLRGVRRTKQVDYGAIRLGDWGFVARCQQAFGATAHQTFTVRRRGAISVPALPRPEHSMDSLISDGR